MQVSIVTTAQYNIDNNNVSPPTRLTSKHVINDAFFQLGLESKSVDQFKTKMRKKVKECRSGDLSEGLVMQY